MPPSPPLPPEAARRHYLGQQALSARVVAAVVAMWREVDPTSLDESWRDLRIGTRAFVAISAGQQVAASVADRYTTAVLDEQGVQVDARGTVVPSAFSGIAADGRSLDTLVLAPMVAAKRASSSSLSLDQIMFAGETSMTRLAATQVADAGRTAVGAAIVARRHVTYVRMLNPPSCDRCTVLAGRNYGWNEGFLRHERCDCQHIPTAPTVEADFRPSPRETFDSLGGAEQDRYFTKAGAQAVRDGADINQVVNARRGISRAGSRPRDRPGRLMPEQIYKQAANRDEALAALHTHGYLR